MTIEHHPVITDRPDIATLARNTGLHPDTPVQEAMPDLPTRALNCLMRERYKTIGALTQATDLDLLDIRNFGITCLDDVKTALTQRLAPEGSPEAARWQDRARHAGTLRYVADRLLNAREPLDVPETLRNLAKRLAAAADTYESAHGAAVTQDATTHV